MENFVLGVAPFSCCNVKRMRPCITWFVEEPDSGYNYDPKTDLSLYEKGCGSGMTESICYWILMLAYVLLYSRIVQAVGIVLSRLVQTSLALAIDYADPTQSAAGYIIVFGMPPQPPSALADPAMIKKKKELLKDLAYSSGF
ncbi:hypothetical protein HELRODRAFT_159050 [Helobdella robusta]|uniref:Uncharacterized protein n=1 Tax=Helobdella robusta TaxID=6412 RepID=T1ENJ0_HELRO|nr:hypothetical protein HELRODRAFT_159050 [Helobdella robusta]ESO12502.1 hypothetical protein HELRODRAFT_159050 [Helobdella robusta]